MRAVAALAWAECRRRCRGDLDPGEYRDCVSQCVGRLIEEWEETREEWEAFEEEWAEMDYEEAGEEEWEEYAAELAKTSKSQSLFSDLRDPIYLAFAHLHGGGGLRALRVLVPQTLRRHWDLRSGRVREEVQAMCM